MSFRLSQTFPQRAPDVQVFFHGLLMLCPNADGSMCEVGVHRLSVEHRLSVSVRERATEAPDPPLLRLAGPLDSMGLTIEVTPTSSGVSAFVPTPEPFDRANESNDAKDFRWSVDLDQLDPAGPPVRLIRSAIQPTIKVMDGLFHTARLTNPALLTAALTQIGSPPIVLTRVAHLLGANIYLEQLQKVRITWFGDGDTQRLELPGSNGEKTFVINIDNSPALMPVGKPTHSEFVEFFKAVASPPRKFDLDFNKVGEGFHGTDEAPCMPVVVGGGGGGGGH